MTPENREIFRDSLTEKIEEHLASGGTIHRGSFGWYGDDCCPLAVALDEKAEEDFCCHNRAVVFGIDCSEIELWSFIFGVDEKEQNFEFLYPGEELDREMFQMGQDIGRKYCGVV